MFANIRDMKKQAKKAFEEAEAEKALEKAAEKAAKKTYAAFALQQETMRYASTHHDCPISSFPWHEKPIVATVRVSYEAEALHNGRQSSRNEPNERHFISQEAEIAEHFRNLCKDWEQSRKQKQDVVENVGRVAATYVENSRDLEAYEDQTTTDQHDLQFDTQRRHTEERNHAPHSIETTNASGINNEKVLSSTCLMVFISELKLISTKFTDRNAQSKCHPNRYIVQRDGNFGH